MVPRAGGDLLQAYKMSTHADDEPTGRVRRKTSLPSRYGDYDLTGFVLPTLHPEPVSPHTQIPSNLSDEEDQEEGAMEFKLPQIPDDEHHSSEEWSDNDPGRSENALLKQRNRNLRYANENMLHTVQVMQMERDALKQTSQQYAQELSQLKWQMQQLQIQASQLQPVAQPQLSKPIPAPRQGKNMQSAEGSLKPVPVPRFRGDRFSSQEQSSVLAAVPGDKIYSPYNMPSAQPFSQGIPEEEESYHQGHGYYPPYNKEQAASTPYDSAWRHQTSYSSSRQVPQFGPESMYKGPTPTIPDFVHPNPREFSRLKIALENILPANATEKFKFQILTDHLKLEEALLIADSYSHSQTPFTKTMAALDLQYGQPHQLALQ